MTTTAPKKDLFTPWQPDPRIEEDADDVETEVTNPYVIDTIGMDPKDIDAIISGEFQYNPDDDPNVERPEQYEDEGDDE